jgi:hypothetical protein
MKAMPAIATTNAHLRLPIVLVISCGYGVSALVLLVLSLAGSQAHQWPLGPALYQTLQHELGLTERIPLLIPSAFVAVAVGLWRLDATHYARALLINSFVVAAYTVQVARTHAITLTQWGITIIIVAATVVLASTSIRAHLHQANLLQRGIVCPSCGLVNIHERNTCKQCQARLP